MTLSQSDAWETNYLVGTASSFINTDRDLGCCKLTLLWLALSQELSENRSPGAAGVLQTADSPTRKSSRLLLGRIAECPPGFSFCFCYAAQGLLAELPLLNFVSRQP